MYSNLFFLLQCYDSTPTRSYRHFRQAHVAKWLVIARHRIEDTRHLWAEKLLWLPAWKQEQKIPTRQQADAVLADALNGQALPNL